MQNRMILIVDDEKNARWALSKGLRGQGFGCLEAASAQEALKILSEDKVDAVLLDINLGKDDGMDLIARIIQMLPDMKIIMVTAYNDAKRAVRSLKEGAFDYITKPYDIEELIIALQRALKMSGMEKEIETLHEIYGKPLPEIIGQSPAVLEMKKLLSRTFNNDVPVLITGESGTGKELCARAVHENSSRKKNAFIAANISALPDNLVEAELFGYEKGAFTGSVKARKGYFELADGGTLFLDEMGEISPHVQVKLLRVLETGEVPVIGLEKTRKTDVRIICATNRNLREEVKSGSFREDLFYRISVFHIIVPPLRQRGKDLELLAEYFFEKYSRDTKTPKKLLLPETIKSLYAQSWKGNIREFFHVLERAALVSDSEWISPRCLPEFEAQNTDLHTGTDLTSRVESFEMSIIALALKENNENQLKTAQALGLSRTSLIYKLKKYGFLTEDDGKSTPE